MGYGMKYTKGGFPFKTDKVDLTKKPVGPIETSTTKVTDEEEQIMENMENREVGIRPDQYSDSYIRNQMTKKNKK
jgi:hypothetical protein